MSSEWFDSAILNLKADNISGSEGIVRKAILIVKQQISNNPDVKLEIEKEYIHKLYE